MSAACFFSDEKSVLEWYTTQRPSLLSHATELCFGDTLVARNITERAYRDLLEHLHAGKAINSFLASRWIRWVIRVRAAHRCAKGSYAFPDGQELSAWYTANYKRFLNYATCCCNGNHHVAEDIVHDAYDKLISRFNNFKHSRHAFYWMLTVIKHGAITYFRKRGRQEALLRDLEYIFDLDAPGSHADMQRRKEALLGAVEAALTLLTAPERQVVNSLLAGKTQTKTAEELEVHRVKVTRLWGHFTKLAIEKFRELNLSS
jgi:RNA polymerase sigma factor (sigma-70 family)